MPPRLKISAVAREFNTAIQARRLSANRSLELDAVMA
jgi:hypothetical protein